MPISRLSRKSYKVVDRTIINHTPKPIKIMKTVVMNIWLYVATMTNIANQPKIIEVKTPFTKFMEKMLEEVEYCKSVIKKR